MCGEEEGKWRLGRGSFVVLLWWWSREVAEVLKNWKACGSTVSADSDDELISERGSYPSRR
jgi:hypothetical protein